MIGLQQITTKDIRYYAYMENLLTSSFPVEEYRELSILREYADSLPCFYCHIILDDSNPIGFLSYWDLGDFMYIEHLAVDAKLRNGGYGQEVLAHLDHQSGKPIVLEVERPTEEIAQRRIQFYQRQGYKLWKEEYVQPPYRIGGEELPMYLMVKGKLHPDRDFERIKNTIYRIVYEVEV